MPKKNKKFRKVIFPAGIFLLLVMIFSAISAGGVAAYFLHTGKKKIAVIESYTRSYATLLAKGFGELAAYSYWTKRYVELKKLFRNEIKAEVIDEAFFVLTDGTLIVHSDKKVEKKLKGNIATDEFAYNIEWILRPALKKSKKVQFGPYNVMGKMIPFYRWERKLIKKYLYKDVNLTGWLVSKAVYSGGKPRGTVSFIIYRDRVHDFIYNHIEFSKNLLIYCLSGSFALSLLLSIIILMRYRSLQNKAFHLGIRESSDRYDILSDAPANADTGTDKKSAASSDKKVSSDVVYGTGGLPVNAEIETKDKDSDEDDTITIDLSSKNASEKDETIPVKDRAESFAPINPPVVEEDNEFWGHSQTIKEGIPLNRKVH